jgi:hypothetical protein
MFEWIFLGLGLLPQSVEEDVLRLINIDVQRLLLGRSPSDWVRHATKFSRDETLKELVLGVAGDNPMACSHMLDVHRG